MPFIQRKQDATHPIADSLLCTPCIIGQLAPGSLQDFVLASGLTLVYTEVQTATEEIQVKGAPVVLDDGTPIGTLFAAESLINAGQAITGQALVRVTNAAAATGILRPDLSAVRAPNVGEQVAINTINGAIPGAVGDAAKTIPRPVDGGPDIDDGFTVLLSDGATLTLQDSGAPVIAQDGSWLGMFIYEDISTPVAYCTKAMNM